MAEVVSSFPTPTPTPTGGIMKSYLTQVDVIYNDMNSPIGSGGCIVEKYPDWLEENTLWKVKTRDNSFPVLFPVPAYYELAKASYLELFHQDTLPEWTVHQFKRYNQSLSNITKKRLNQFLEEERNIQEEKEKEEKEQKFKDFFEDLMNDLVDKVVFTEEELEFNEADLDKADLINDKDEEDEEQQQQQQQQQVKEGSWLSRYLLGFFSV
jgi:hypothetical protein